MKKIQFRVIVLVIALLWASPSKGQNKVSSSGSIKIFSLLDEYIDGECETFTSSINLQEKSIVVSVNLKGFKFEKAVMQKKFNNEENMNTDTYPKAKFKGAIVSDDSIGIVGKHKVKIEGDMTIKGVTKKVLADAVIITSDNGKINLQTEFMLNGLEYNLTLKYVKEMRINADINY